MAAVLLHSAYSPGPGRGILLNPSPAASPAYHPAALPALVPSNSSLSSSASSSGPGEDYFSSKSSSAAPSPGPSTNSPTVRNSTHLNPHPKPRHGSNPSTVRRIRFAPLPEPRRDLEPTDVPLPPVFLDDDAPESYHTHEQQTMSLSSALHAATMSLAAPGDSDLCRRTRSLPPSVTSSPVVAKKALPGDSLLLDPSTASASAPADPTAADAQHATAHSDLGQEWDVLPSSSPALPTLALPPNGPDSPRKPPTKWTKMLKPLLGRSHKSSLTRSTSAEEIAAMNAEAQRGRGLALGLAGSRNSSRSRDASVSRERDQDRDKVDFGLYLQRCTSDGQPILPVSKKKKHSLFGGGGGVPLGRTQSLTSLSGKDDRKAPKPMVVTNGGRKQQRMLNGRVYGAKRNQNPFANVRSEEPEFVEWGYGGMGSVKASAGQSEIWSRVQKGSVAIGGDENSWGRNGPATAPRTSAEEDDGSGMAWLKKRREQREREKKEREEREKADAAAKADAEGEPEPAEADPEEKSAEAPPAEGEGETKAEPAQAEALPIANAPVTPTPALSTPLAPEAHPSPSPSHGEHITQTVTIPAPHHRHHHSHSHSHSHSHGHHHAHGHSLSLSLPHPQRRESADTARGVPFPSALTPMAAATPTGHPETADDSQGTPILDGARLRQESVTEGEGGESLSSSATSTTSSTSEDVDDSEDSPKGTQGSSGEEDEDEDDDVEQERGRSTMLALSAGVEKIARHKEHEREQQAAAEAEAEAEAST